MRYSRIVGPSFVVALMVSFARGVAAQAAPYNPPAVISTSGQGEARVVPDRASVLVTIQSRAATASAAGSANARRTKAVLDAFAELGLSRDQLVTEGYSVYPQMKYDSNGTAPHVVGYLATNAVRADTKHTDQAGAIIDAAIGAGADIISSLNFYASSVDDARRQAMTGAVESARADAEAIAKAAGGALGALVEISTSGPTVPPRPMFDLGQRARAAVAEPTPINPGQQTVSVRVSARWQFVPSR